MLLEGEYHYKTRGYLTSFYGKNILKIAADYDFINTKININFIHLLMQFLQLVWIEILIF